jgi:hypothetical protein
VPVEHCLAACFDTPNSVATNWKLENTVQICL